MAAITVTRLRVNQKPGHYVVRGQGAYNSTDTSGTLGGLPVGNVIGFKAISAQASPTAVAYALNNAPSAGVIACTGSLTVVRSAGTDSGGTFLFEVEYDSN